MSHLETYLQKLRDDSMAGVAETSLYPALYNLLNAVGGTLKPKVRCVINPANRGAGIPDGGLFTADQFKKGKDDKPLRGLIPDRGAIEVKPVSADAGLTVDTEQVTRYWDTYGLVLVTNYRDFVLVGKRAGKPVKLETYSLASTEDEFWSAAATPRKTTELHELRFTEYLKRVMLHAAPINRPQDVAWFLASYARDARLRIEQQPDLPALASVRTALEDALGMKFKDAKGEHFFRSTLVQTLFYGVFSAWVLWHGEDPSPKRSDTFDWRTAAQRLRVPVLRRLFYQVMEPGGLEELNLEEVLNWTGTVLNRVDRTSFFAHFEERHAIQYFYEPFLEAFDPELRKRLGVWYTPNEIVRYQVNRVDTVLREELGIADGLADKRVYVLDPCCGTGAYLIEVLHKIAATLKANGGDALLANDLKQAVTKRVFGFEILPAPFVISHLQIGLLLQHLGVPLSDKKGERVGVYLTNALTGWEPVKNPKQHLLFKEFEDERDAADQVKREEKILVILGNPPYSGFAGVAMGEERSLSEAYRTTKKAPAPQGQGLNELYVRFFRMADRRIVEMNQPAQGIVCFISNYSWLDGLSFTGMRERYLDAFDRIAIDCLNGDKYKTGKLTPDGKPDPSVFSTETNHEGIQVGTAITLLVRNTEHQPTCKVAFRHLWGKTKRADLLAGPGKYDAVTPVLDMGLVFVPLEVREDYSKWRPVNELFPYSSFGFLTNRDDALVSIDREPLIARMTRYFDPNVTNAQIAEEAPVLMAKTQEFDPVSVRSHLLERGLSSGEFVRLLYRPFDTRWLFWHPETKLVERRREEFRPHIFPENVVLAIVRQNRKGFTEPLVTSVFPSHHLIERGANYFPLYLKDSLLGQTTRKPNLSEAAAAYLAALKAAPEDLFYHTLAILHAFDYRTENAGALQQDWPRVPLPDSKKTLQASAALGRQVAALLDSETPVKIDSKQFNCIGPIKRVDSKNINTNAGDLDLTAGWGHAGQGGVTMPGKGKVVNREYNKEEAKTLSHAALTILGPTRDVYLNDRAYWSNVPMYVWDYTLGGYQVLKKWLSYREKELLGRALTPEEARAFTDIARRIAALLLLQPELDRNYQTTKAATCAGKK